MFTKSMRVGTCIVMCLVYDFIILLLDRSGHVARLFADNGDYDFAVTRLVVTLQMKDLLPGAEHWAVLRDRHRQGRSEQ